MLREQVGDGPIRRVLLAQLRDDILCREQILEFLRTAGCEFFDRLADCCWIKRGHRLNPVDVNLETTRPRGGHGNAAAWTGLPLVGFTANAGLKRGFGHGQFRIAACLRIIRGRHQSPSKFRQGRVVAVDAD